MSLHLISALRIATLFSLAVSGQSHADWTTSIDLAAVRPGPEQFQIQAQNPPGFTWSRHPKAATNTWYIVVMTSSTGVLTKGVTARNWYLPPKTLVSGQYTWKVSPFIKTAKMTEDESAARTRARNGGSSAAAAEQLAMAAILPAAEAAANDWSDLRNFVVDASSSSFVVVESEGLKSNVLAHGRSRSLPANFLPYSRWDAAMIAERGAAVKSLIADVTSRIGVMAPVRDSDWSGSAQINSTSAVPAATLTAAASAQSTDIRTRVTRAAHQLEAAALLYRLQQNDAKGPVYLAEAISRGEELAALSPTGATSYVNQDQATRSIALSLAKAVDLLWNDLTLAQRNRWLAVINVRTDAIYKDLSGSNGRMDQYPFDSHGGNTLGFLALISALTVGDIPAAQNWFDFSVRTYIHQIYAWSGPEGGYANGSAYGQVAVDYSLQIWDPLGQAIGLNLYKKPWASGFSRFFMHFVPPGSVTHVFGDGHEDKPNTNILKGYASRFATPEAKWYYSNLVGTEDPLTLLMAPSPLPVNQIAASKPPANAALYRSIGWVAMHSDIADRMRTSLYFKSSPFGAYNHSHGDQNSIVLVSGGKPLMIEAGYYDWYGSPLWNDWYRQTKSHNGITFDGGAGQGTDGNNINLARTGSITAFSTTSTLDYAAGEAVPAYDGKLKTATRKVWYLRGQNAFVVWDTLESTTARAFEWNVHSPTPMTGLPNGGMKIQNGDSSVCMRPIIGGAPFVKRPGAPAKAGTTENHGAYVRPLDKKTEFLILLDVDCKNPAVSLTSNATSRTVLIGGQAITLPK